MSFLGFKKWPLTWDLDSPCLRFAHLEASQRRRSRVEQSPGSLAIWSIWIRSAIKALGAWGGGRLEEPSP